MYTKADIQAINTVVAALPNNTEAERQYLLTIARGESYYGLGWKNEGVGSKNWGAVQGVGSAGSFQTTDSHANLSKYTGTFKRYSSDSEAIEDMAAILLKPNVKLAIETGSLKDAVFAQHSNGYFELAPELYLLRVVQNYNTLATSPEWNKLLS